MCVRARCVRARARHTCLSHVRPRLSLCADDEGMRDILRETMSAENDERQLLCSLWLLWHRVLQAAALSTEETWRRWHFLNITDMEALQPHTGWFSSKKKEEPL